jgi:predicted nucleic acid-binding protein
MSNKIFIDSSVLVEYRKGNHLPLLNALLADTASMLYISQAVVSEYLFHHLAMVGGKSPLAIKESRQVPEILVLRDPTPFLELFTWLPDEAAFLRPAVQFMATYNLLPNDALILAACKHHGIPAIASFDPDFAAPCQGEGIQLLQSVADFEEFQRRG